MPTSIPLCIIIIIQCNSHTSSHTHTHTHTFTTSLIVSLYLDAAELEGGESKVTTLIGAADNVCTLLEPMIWIRSLEHYIAGWFERYNVHCINSVYIVRNFRGSRCFWGLATVLHENCSTNVANGNVRALTYREVGILLAKYLYNMLQFQES